VNISENIVAPAYPSLKLAVLEGASVDGIIFSN
jgi:hypothetical protein